VSRARSTAWWLVAVVLVALNLRTPLAALPPLADAVAADLRLTATATGALTTLPVLCMGLFAPVGALASRRYGRERVLAGALLLTAAGSALRAVPVAAALFVATALTGVGIAVAGALLPPLVRARFPHRVGPVTGLYTAGLIGGAMLAAGLAEPARRAFGGSWAAALAVWAVPAVVALLVWSAVLGPVPPGPGPGARRAGGRHEPGSPPDPVPGPGRPPGQDVGVLDARRPAHRLAPWRSRTAWLATVYMGGQSLMFYGALAWLAARYTALGWSAATAGALLAVFSAAQLVSALLLPVLAHRRGGLAAPVAGCVATSAAALVAIGLVPTTAAWLWAVLLGLGVGGQFALALTLLGSLGRTPADAGAVSGMAFFVGYLLAASGPVAAGALHDATGDYRAPFVALAAVGVVALVAGVLAARRAA
jgi:MFS transporter, CP family, cyanate transporter